MLFFWYISSCRIDGNLISLSLGQSKSNELAILGIEAQSVEVQDFTK